jgi:hypothetical protein
MFLLRSRPSQEPDMTIAARRRATTEPPAAWVSSGPRPVPFRSAEEAWFWTMAALRARHDGAQRSTGSRLPRPCEPDDVIRCLDLLYRRRSIALEHARVLRLWGERGQAPDPTYPAERGEAELWCLALGRLEWLLRVKGIVGGA